MEDQVFVRVHRKGLDSGVWVARKESLIGLTPQQIKVKLNLPHVPEFIQEVHVPKGTAIRRGTVGANQFGETVGPIQYQIQSELPAAAYGKSTPLGKVVE